MSPRATKRPRGWQKGLAHRLADLLPECIAALESKRLLTLAIELAEHGDALDDPSLADRLVDVGCRWAPREGVPDIDDRSRGDMSGADRVSFDFGDCGLRRMSTAQHFWMGRRYTLPQYSWFRYSELAHPDRYGGVLDLLWFDDSGRDYDPSEQALDRHYRKAECMSMRSAWNDAGALVIGVQAGQNRDGAHRHLDLGSFILEALGEAGKAARIYSRAGMADERLWRLHLELGLALEAKGSYTLAEHSYDKLLVKDDRFYDAYRGLAVILLSRGEYIEALDILERARDLGEDFPEYYNLLGRAYIYNGRFEEAIAELTTCVELAPKNGEYAAMVDGICKRLGLTTLRYQTLGAMIEAIGLPRERLCTYCWSGESLYEES